jgi:branched-chain amino acid transport system permease protein
MEGVGARPLVPGWGQYALAAGFVGLLVLLPQGIESSYWLRIAGSAGLWVMLALGLNVVAGFAGLLDLGYIAFYAIGAYSYALLASSHFDIHLPFWAVVPAAFCTASAFGWLLGAACIRLRGDYLAIVTLAFAQIVRMLLLNLDRPVNLTGGPNGIPDLDFPELFGFRLMTVEHYYYLILGFAVLVTLGSLRLKTSRLGRGWEAIREDELAARASGVNATFMKLLAFGLGAGLAGMAGAVFASWQGGVFPSNFDFPQLVTVYCMLILGGAGNIGGIVLAAVVLAILPEALRDYGGWRMTFYGVLLIVMMILRPQGILGEFSIARFVSRGLARNRTQDKVDDLQSAEELFYDSAGHPAKEPVATRLEPGKDALVLDGVSMQFGGLQAVSSLSLRVGQGEVVSIIGPNGAGKSTVFNLVTGVYRPTAGRILFEGNDITGLPPHKVTGLGVARTFQSLRLFDNMTVLENAMVARFSRTRAGLASILLRLPRHVREEAASVAAARANLALFGARLTGFRQELKPFMLSYANRRRLEIARALSTDCRLVLLDEPSAGMNPKETAEMTDFIRRLRDDYGYTVLVIEHKLGLVRTISDRVAVLDFGVKIAEGTYDEVVDDPAVVAAYLGRKREASRG